MPGIVPGGQRVGEIYMVTLGYGIKGLGQSGAVGTPNGPFRTPEPW